MAGDNDAVIQLWKFDFLALHRFDGAKASEKLYKTSRMAMKDFSIFETMNFNESVSNVCLSGKMLGSG